MANLVKELKNKASEKREEMNELSAITEVTRLIANDGADDLNILREMGMATSVEYFSNLHGKKIELEKLDAEYGQVFTKEEIKAVACKYALKFLRSDNYKGQVPPELASKVKQFFKDSGTDMNGAKLGFNMFVLAPYKDFNLVEHPVPKVEPEPLLFYKLDENHFRLIYKWGSDLTLWNRILGMKNAHWTGYWAFWTTKIFLFYGPLFIQVAYWSWLSKISTGFIFLPAVAILVSILTGLGMAVNTDSRDRMIFKPWEEEWNTNFAPKY